ncbi:hypothetical protein C7A12_30045, partial [Pseudomonas fluorescens]
AKCLRTPRKGAFTTWPEQMLTGCLQTVGASLLAKNLRAPRSIRQPALLLTFFASKLAPTRARR